MKIIEIHETRSKSSEDEKPAWNRAKVSIGAAGPLIPLSYRYKLPCPEIHQNPKEVMKSNKSFEIYENHEIYEIRAFNEKQRLL